MIYSILQIFICDIGTAVCSINVLLKRVIEYCSYLVYTSVHRKSIHTQETNTG